MLSNCKDMQVVTASVVHDIVAAASAAQQGVVLL
jgi:hypothetical protein